MKEFKYSNEKISNASFNVLHELGRDEINSKFPYLANRENARVIKLSFPIGIESQDSGVKRILDATAAKNKVKMLKDMPIHFAFDEAGLPSIHHDGDEDNRPEIGHIIDAEVNGETIICYALVHPVTQKRATELIQANKKLLGNSWEIIPKEGYLNEAQNTEVIMDWDWVGMAILDRNAAAYPQSRVLAANKQVQEAKAMAETETKTEIIKVIDETMLKENIELRKAKEESDKAKIEAEMKEIAEKAAEKAKAEAEIKIKEAEEKTKKAEEDIAKLTTQITAENLKREEEQKNADEKSRKDKAVLRAGELKEFLDGVKEEDTKAKIVAQLEKMPDEDYDIFKLGKIKVKTKEQDSITSMGAAIPAFAGKSLKDVSKEELENVYGKLWVK